MKNNKNKQNRETDFRYLLGLSEVWDTTQPKNITQNHRQYDELIGEKVDRKEKIVHETDKQTDLSNQSLNPLNLLHEEGVLYQDVFENHSSNKEFKDLDSFEDELPRTRPGASEMIKR